MKLKPYDSQIEIAINIRDNILNGFLILYKTLPGLGKTSMSVLNITWNLISNVLVTLIGIYYFGERINNLKMDSIVWESGAATDMIRPEWVSWNNINWTHAALFCKPYGKQIIIGIIREYEYFFDTKSFLFIKYFTFFKNISKIVAAHAFGDGIINKLFVLRR